MTEPTIAEHLRDAQPPAGVQLLTYRGSIAHGTHNPDPESIDDIDLIGFVVAPVEHYLGLTEWGSRGTQEIKSGRYDCVYYEMRKAFSLLMAGNPNVLCTLWTDPQHVLTATPHGRRLLEVRDAFLGKHIFKPLVGYAAGQLHRMESQDKSELVRYLRVTNEMKVRGVHPNHRGETFEPDPECERLERLTDDELRAEYKTFVSKGSNIGYMGDKRKRLVLEHGYDAKNAAHCIRLLRMGKELFETGSMSVLRPDAEELREVKQGRWPLDRVKAHAAELLADVESAMDKSSLPDEPDRARLERELVAMIRSELALTN